MADDRTLLLSVQSILLSSQSRWAPKTQAEDTSARTTTDPPQIIVSASEGLRHICQEDKKRKGVASTGFILQGSEKEGVWPRFYRLKRFEKKGCSGGSLKFLQLVFSSAFQN